MAPIHDTDVAEKRWHQSEWNHYELWEKVEVRLKRRKRLWIFATVAVFLALSSVPVLQEQFPHWKALAATRRLAQEINRIKTEAGMERAAFRIKFDGLGAFTYSVIRAGSCSDPNGEVVRKGQILKPKDQGGYVVLSQADGEKLGIPGLIDQYCYDYLAGSDVILEGRPMAGFGVLSAKDLAEGRSDRAAILLVSGPAGELAFE